MKSDNESKDRDSECKAAGQSPSSCIGAAAAPGEQGFVSARRRLLQGAFAAPAVCALYSGSAVAMASSGRCLANQLSNPVYPPATSDPADNFVRVRLWSLRPSSNAGYNNARWFVRGTDIEALRSSGPNVGFTFLGASQCVQFDPGNPATSYPVTADPPRWSAESAGYLAPENVWVAVRVDSSGMGVDIIGVVGPSLDGSAIAGTCWTSVVNGAV